MVNTICKSFYSILTFKNLSMIGTEAALLADANARECLDAVASLTAPPTGSTALEDILSAIHGAKDKHIFRLLSSIVDPVQKPKTRARAFEDLPRRTKPLGEAASTWVKNLVRRCTMGDFMNGDVIAHCVLLARECFMEHDIPTCSLLVAAAKVGVDSFPELGAQPQTFQTLQELVCDCRKARTADIKREIEESGVVTLLSSILKNASKTTDIKVRQKKIFLKGTQATFGSVSFTSNIHRNRVPLAATTFRSNCCISALTMGRQSSREMQFTR